MKIIRNGETFELTPAELTQAYDEKEREYRHEDILSKLDEMIENEDIALDENEYPNGVLDEGTLDVIYERFERILGRSDLYYECFWDAIENAINDVLKED